MLSRTGLWQIFYDKLRMRQVSISKGDIAHADKLTEEIEDLSSYLVQLRGISESKDNIEELHFRFLAKCTLLNIAGFRINGLIGGGQCGVVYRAHKETAPKEEVAIKLLYFPRNAEERFRFEQEGRILYELDHPAIVKGLNITKNIEFLPVQWYAMELIKNAVTFEKFSENSPLTKSIDVLAKVCEGLDYAHQRKVIHRDLHFGNILVTENERPKILDFGSAKYRDDAFTFRPVGSLKGCSPEKLNNPQKVDGKSDVFSVGCILYYVVKKKWPFVGATFGDLVQKLTHCQYDPLSEDKNGLRECVRDALQHNPSKRPDAKILACKLHEISNKLNDAGD